MKRYKAGMGNIKEHGEYRANNELPGRLTKISRIPLRRAQELSATYNVAHLLAPLLEFDPAKAGNVPVAGPRKRPNPNAPSASIYYRTGPGAAQLAAAKDAAETNSGLTPLSAASPVSNLQPRFISLRPPPDTEKADQVYGERVLDRFPKGTTAEQRNTLNNNRTVIPSGEHTVPKSRNNKRGIDAVSDDEAEHGIKKQRPEDFLGPSPVKDLNALGRNTSPTSALRGVRVPTRSGRISLGPPDAFKALQLDGTRFADRPYTVQEGNEAERRMRTTILDLFVAERLAIVDADEQSEHVTPSDERKLDELLVDMRQAAASATTASPESAEQNPLGQLNGQAEHEEGISPVDLVIDDHGHSALHWAAALAKLSYVRMLIAKPPSADGANPHAGNHGGETALQRSVLVSNAYDTSTFPILLHLLAPSLYTRDYRRRTILHHIALVSQIRGRSVSARYYLACTLDYIAKYQGARYTPFIDAQDDDGETALSIVARNGNANMVKMLLDVGARRDIVNCLGLRASDWGIDGLDNADESSLTQDDISSKERPSEAVTSLTRPPKGPVHKSKDVLEQMTTVLSDLADVFQKELSDKTEAFNVAQSHLQTATRELAVRRRKITESQTNVTERDEARTRRQNLAKVLKEEMGLDIDEDEQSMVTQCLEWEQAQVANQSDMDVDNETLSVSEQFKDERPFQDNQENDLVNLRWLSSWYEKNLRELQERIQQLDDAAHVKMGQCRKVVAMCCGVPEEKVEGMLDELVTAIESIGVEGVDLQRLAGFLSKVKDPRSL